MRRRRVEVLGQVIPPESDPRNLSRIVHSNSHISCGGACTDDSGRRMCLGSTRIPFCGARVLSLSVSQDRVRRAEMAPFPFQGNGHPSRMDDISGF